MKHHDETTGQKPLDFDRQSPTPATLILDCPPPVDTSAHDPLNTFLDELRELGWTIYFHPQGIPLKDRERQIGEDSVGTSAHDLNQWFNPHAKLEAWQEQMRQFITEESKVMNPNNEPPKIGIIRGRASPKHIETLQRLKELKEEDEAYSNAEHKPFKGSRIKNKYRNVKCPCGSGKKFKKCCWHKVD